MHHIVAMDGARHEIVKHNFATYAVPTTTLTTTTTISITDIQNSM
jgi:hypothetical protein